MSPELPISSHLCIRESIYGSVMIKLMTVNGQGENNFGRQMGNATQSGASPRSNVSAKSWSRAIPKTQFLGRVVKPVFKSGFRRTSTLQKKLVLLGHGMMGAFFRFHESDNSLQLSNRRCFLKKELGQLKFKLNKGTNGRATENFSRCYKRQGRDGEIVQLAETRTEFKSENQLNTE